MADDDVLVITSMNSAIADTGVAYRIFKDMRDNTAMYKISESVETYLVSAISATSDTIYVSDVSKLSEPDLQNAVFGILMVDGERITYSSRNLSNNSVTGLRRGTAGTGASAHDNFSLVQNVGKDSYVPWRYDLIWYEGAEIRGADQYYDNGIGFDDSTVNVTGDAPGEDTVTSDDVDEQYGFGSGYFDLTRTPSNGVTLQDQTTVPALFIKT